MSMSIFFMRGILTFEHVWSLKTFECAENVWNYSCSDITETIVVALMQLLSGL